MSLLTIFRGIDLIKIWQHEMSSTNLVAHSALGGESFNNMLGLLLLLTSSEFCQCATRIQMYHSQMVPKTSLTPSATSKYLCCPFGESKCVCPYFNMFFQANSCHLCLTLCCQYAHAFWIYLCARAWWLQPNNWQADILHPGSKCWESEDMVY